MISYSPPPDWQADLKQTEAGYNSKALVAFDSWPYHTEEPARTTVHEGEPWTARKVFRRFLEREREHLGQIEEILATHGIDRLASL